MSAQWSKQVVGATKNALVPLRNATNAGQMASYMKDVAPFLGIKTPERRHACRAAWSSLAIPLSDDLGRAAIDLMALPEREYHYAAYDLIDRYISSADEYFLDTYVSELLVTKSWWDSVDGLVTAAVSPLCFRYDADWLIDEWSKSGNMWLIRAAIGHQRGWRFDTDVPRVIELCHHHWDNPEFFVAKAIGWALRDLAHIDSAAVRHFLSSRTSSNKVAQREAERGLSSTRRPWAK